MICWQLQHDKSFRWDEILQVLDLPDASRSHELDLRCSHGQKIHHNDPRALKRRGCCANLKPSRLLSHSERFRSSLQGHSNYSTNTSPRSDLYMNLSMCTWICCFFVVCVCGVVSITLWCIKCSPSLSSLKYCDSVLYWFHQFSPPKGLPRMVSLGLCWKSATARVSLLCSWPRAHTQLERHRWLFPEMWTYQEATAATDV